MRRFGVLHSVSEMRNSKTIFMFLVSMNGIAKEQGSSISRTPQRTKSSYIKASKSRLVTRSTQTSPIHPESSTKNIRPVDTSRIRRCVAATRNGESSISLCLFLIMTITDVSPGANAITTGSGAMASIPSMMCCCCCSRLFTASTFSSATTSITSTVLSQPCTEEPIGILSVSLGRPSPDSY